MMKSKDFFSHLQQEIIINILSTLPIKTITRCKFVCKSWRDLIESPDFGLTASSHRSKSPFIVVVLDNKPYEIYAFADEHLVQGRSKDNEVLLLRHNLPTPHENTSLRYLSSANGLFLMLEFPTSGDLSSHNLSICNPTTREYMKLPPPRIGPPLSGSSILGFGSSKRSRQYKVVKIFTYGDDDYDYFGRKCEVYTLGRGVWRYHHIFNLRTRFRLVGHERNKTGALVNGNLHWLVSSSQKDLSIYGFDLETECFTISSAPLLRGGRYLVLSTLEDRLCLCDISPPHSETVKWVMKDYGDEKSWTKQLSFIIRLPWLYNNFSEYFFPVKVYEDGDMLFAARFGAQLYCYSTEKKIIPVSYRNLRLLRNNGICGVAIYTPNFVSLKSLLGNQN